MNDYQQLMLRISELTPYNAVHAVKLTKHDLDVMALHKAVDNVLLKLNLGVPAFDHSRRLVHFTSPQDAIQIGHRSLLLEDHMAFEMNTPFAIHEVPLRFFIVTNASQYYFAVTYNHWVADAYSIMRLIESIFLTATGHSGSGQLTLLAPPLEQCFKKVYGKKLVYYRYWGMLRNIVDYARAYRCYISHVESTTTGCCHYFFSEQELLQLLHVCKVRQITLNDLFITVLAQLFGTLTANNRTLIKRRLWKGKRDKLVISVMSNIRKQSSVSLSHTFGVYLGFFSLFFKDPERYSFDQLQQMVSNKTQTFKRQNIALKLSTLWGIQTKRWDRCVTKRRQYQLFSKSVPITVGISNISLNAELWPRSDLYQDYIRCSPTAMVCPMVFNITTQHQTMSLAMSYRKVCYTDHDAIEIRGQFINRIRALIDGAGDKSYDHAIPGELG